MTRDLSAALQAVQVVELGESAVQRTFGASIVKGFALTLALGVGVSLFTAIIVTRTILHVVLNRVDFSARHGLFGI